MNSVTVHTQDDITIIELYGILDVQKSPEVSQLVNDLIDKGVLKIVFDLFQLTRISSSGIRVFIETMRKIKAKQGTMKIANMNSTVKRIFMVVEIIDNFETYPSLDEAIKSFVS